MPDETHAADAVETVDTVGLRCPLPLFHAREALLDLPAGARIEVLSDDPQAPGDFDGWTRQNGHLLVSVQTRGRCYHILIQKGKDA